jgi:membrane protein DedA with SNARE-associated domain
MNLGETAGQLLQDYGYLAVFLLPMLESTGVPVPGETMLLTAAVYAATTGRLNIALVIAAAAAGAIIGDNFGYVIGRKGGRALALRYGRFVRVGGRQLDLAERFFARHGDKTVFLARFVAILRTIGAFVAGVSRMRYRNFLIYNAAGGIAWATLFGIVAYALGRQFERYHALFTQFGIGLAVLGVVGAVAFALFGRRRLERWALGDEEKGP